MIINIWEVESLLNEKSTDYGIKKNNSHLVFNVFPTWNVTGRHVIRRQRVLLKVWGGLAAAADSGGLVGLEEELGRGRLRHLLNRVKPVVRVVDLC